MTIGEQYRPLRDVVCDALRSSIIAGEHPPGTHLVEDRLAAELGVSRNPVREALRVLDSEGFVRVVPRKGAVVADLSDDEVAEVFEVRVALEGLAAELAARKADERGVARLREILDVASQALADGDQATVVDLNTSFHEAVLELSGNGFLYNVMGQLRGRMKWIFSQTAGTSRGAESLREHRELAKAIANGDDDGSSRLAREHVAAAARSYWKAVEQARDGNQS